MSTSSRRHLIQPFILAIRIASLCFVIFVAGAAALHWKVFPGPALLKAFRGADALIQLTSRKSEIYGKGGLWFAAPKSGSGVTRYDSTRACPGYTLYSSIHTQGASLVDMRGKPVHTWQLTYDKVWDKSSPIVYPTITEYVQWRDVRLLPSGDLILSIEAQGNTPWGCGIIKIDASSALIWKYLQPAHHQFDIDAQGNIGGFVHHIRRDTLPGAGFLPVPFIEDFFVLLSPEGREIRRVSLFEAFRDSRYCAALRSMPVGSETGDYSHANSVCFVTDSTAPLLPFARAGQVLISMRELDMLAMLDIETKKIVWVATGMWRRQHDADILPNGHILLFSNKGQFGPGGSSMILDYDPLARAVTWDYTGATDAYFFSGARGSQERLVNGNTLITESERGRIFEVTPGKEIVWEFWNPVRGGPGRDRIPVVYSGTRVAPESLSPEFRKVLAE